MDYECTFSVSRGLVAPVQCADLEMCFDIARRRLPLKTYHKTFSIWFRGRLYGSYVWDQACGMLRKYTHIFNGAFYNGGIEAHQYVCQCTASNPGRTIEKLEKERELKKAIYTRAKKAHKKTCLKGGPNDAIP